MKTPPERNIRIIMELINAALLTCVYQKYNRRRPPPDITITPPPIVLGMGTLRAGMSRFARAARSHGMMESGGR